MLANAFSDALRLLAGDAVEDFLEDADVGLLIDDGAKAGCKEWPAVVRLHCFAQPNAFLPGYWENETRRMDRVNAALREVIIPVGVHTNDLLPHPESHAAPISVR